MISPEVNMLKELPSLSTEQIRERLSATVEKIDALKGLQSNYTNENKMKFYDIYGSYPALSDIDFQIANLEKWRGLYNAELDKRQVNVVATRVKTVDIPVDMYGNPIAPQAPNPLAPKLPVAPAPQEIIYEDEPPSSVDLFFEKYKYWVIGAVALIFIGLGSVILMAKNK